MKIKPITPMTRQDEFETALPSRLIQIALEDLESIEQQHDTYSVNMIVYHVPYVEGTNKCLVCFAGCVMANTLQVSSTQLSEPGDFDHNITERLRALDNFRQGFIMAGLERMGYFYYSDMTLRDKIQSINFMQHPDTYHNDPELFKSSMKFIVTELKKLGL